MCLIIHKPAGATFNPTLFSVVKFHNPHGFGVMYPDNGVIRARKGLLNLHQILQLWDELKDKNLAIHFRYATEGMVTMENCHPFRVLNREKHGRDLYMMHNGTIKAVPIKDKGRSDTFHFVTHYLAPLLQEQPELIDHTKFQEFVGGMIGQSKLVFMDGDGKVIIINRDLGSTRGDVWVSNQYSLKYPRPETRRGAKAKAAATGTVVGGTTTHTTTRTHTPAVVTPPANIAKPAVTVKPNVVNPPPAYPARSAVPAVVTTPGVAVTPPKTADLMVNTALVPTENTNSGRQLEGILPRVPRLNVVGSDAPKPFIPLEHF
jgi:glutamine amidotransferase